MMRHLLIIAILIPSLSFSQLILKEDNKYYNQKNELYSGTYIEYYPSGNKRIEMNLLLGQKHGKTIIYFDNEVINEIRSFNNDLMDGTWLTFNEKAIKVGEANYKNGIKHGKWYIWDDNGTKRYEMEYKEGVKFGIWRIWNKEGKLVAEKKYN